MFEYFSKILQKSICYSPAGRSTDLSRWITFLYFSYWDCLELLSYKSFRKIFLHSPTHVCWSRTRSCWWSARSIANQADDPTLFSNYRPISILPAFSKLFEKVMYNPLINFLNLHNILYSKQFGSRNNHSTALALIDQQHIFSYRQKWNNFRHLLRSF